MLQRLLPSVTAIEERMVAELEADQVDLLTTYLTRCGRALGEGSGLA